MVYCAAEKVPLKKSWAEWRRTNHIIWTSFARNGTKRLYSIKEAARHKDPNEVRMLSDGRSHLVSCQLHSSDCLQLLHPDEIRDVIMRVHCKLTNHAGKNRTSKVVCPGLIVLVMCWTGSPDVLPCSASSGLPRHQLLRLLR